MCFDVKMDLMKISESINVAMLFVIERRGENGRAEGGEVTGGGKQG